MLSIDCETTGFSRKYDDILSISIVNDQKEVLYESLVRPFRKTSWPNAMQVHGITPAMVVDAPKAYQVIQEVKKIIYQEDLCAYNGAFDFKMMEGFFRLTLDPSKLHCCMNRFAKHMGIRSTKAYHTTGYLTHKLSKAAEVSGYPFEEGDKLHGSTLDAKVCAHVWNWLNDQPEPFKLFM